jgi:hypothetical protein
MIYTIGHKENYLAAIAERGTVHKIGKREPNMRAEIYPNGYPGGYAFLTIEDAQRRIVEEGKVGEWDVFGLEADWESDTEPAPNGWWHNLLFDAALIVLDR